MPRMPSPSPPTSGSSVEELAPTLLAWLRARTDAMVELLAALASAESPSLDREAQAAPFSLLAFQLTDIGYLVRTVRARTVGDHLYARPADRRRGAPYQLLLGHMDTVWPVGTLASMPIERRGDELFGPGVVDMKAGLVQIVFALRALSAHGLEPETTPVVLMTTDEEIGSRESKSLILRLARGASRAFVLEAAFGARGALKTARKGTGAYRLTVRGRAAHAGVAPEEGLSAILELSHQIQRLFALNDPERGITVNVGTIDGGLRANVIAPEAVAVVDVRVPTRAAGEEIDAAIRDLRPVGEGLTIEVEGGLGRPPMEATPENLALFATAARLGAALGLELESVMVGGASDGNYTSLHAPTLDGLGPVGAGAHAADERVVVPRLPERAALLALLLLSSPESV
jgi:glutamate carboxypeptidase